MASDNHNFALQDGCQVLQMTELESGPGRSKLGNESNDGGR